MAKLIAGPPMDLNVEGSNCSTYQCFIGVLDLSFSRQALFEFDNVLLWVQLFMIFIPINELIFDCTLVRLRKICRQVSKLDCIVIVQLLQINNHNPYWFIISLRKRTDA
jgi:hypothetical protein